MTLSFPQDDLTRVLELSRQGLNHSEIELHTSIERNSIRRILGRDKRPVEVNEELSVRERQRLLGEMR